jgi:hypothetical protein
MKLTLTRTPKAVAPEIFDACERLVPGSQPCFVRRRPASDATVNKCIFNVRRYLLEHPGSMVLGWDIAVWDHVLIEYIGHAIVQSGNELFCVSPSKYGDSSLLFLRDDSLRFDFDDPMARMPAKKIPLSNEPEVRRFIELEEEELSIKSKYPVTSGQIAIRGTDAIILQTMMREKEQLTLKILLATTPTGGPCFCGSNKRFGDCCRRKLLSAVGPIR